MLTSRNVHILLLGAILGVAAGYVAGSIEVEGTRLDRAGEALATLRASGGGQPHPDVTDEDMLAMFEQALATNPDDVELMTRYATFLFDLRRFADSAEMFDRVLRRTPEDAEVRTYRATSLYAAGKREEAMAEFETALSYDPEQLLALHNLALGRLDLNGDPDAAAQLLARIQAIDPSYEGIPSLQQRIDAAR